MLFLQEGAARVAEPMVFSLERGLIRDPFAADLAVAVRTLLKPVSDGPKSLRPDPDVPGMESFLFRIQAAKAYEALPSGMGRDCSDPAIEDLDLTAGLTHFRREDADAHPLVLNTVGTELNDRSGILGPELLEVSRTGWRRFVFAHDFFPAPQVAVRTADPGAIEGPPTL